jgi:hypothetical protein
MRQVQRLEEPKEMAMFRRFKDMSLARVRSTYTSTGLIDQDLLFPKQAYTSEWGDSSGYTDEGQYYVLSLLEAEDALASIELSRSKKRAVARAETRLGRSGSWSSFTEAEREKLLLSNAEYARRYPQNGGVPLGGVAAGTPSAAGGGNGTT